MKQQKFEEDNDTFTLESENDTLSVDEFLSGEANFIKNPAVGESIEFTLTGVKKKPGKKVKNPITGKMMDIVLSGDDVNYYYEFLTDDGKYLEVCTWQIVGKTKAILRKLGNKFGFKIKIEHLNDGRTAPKGTDSWKVMALVDGKFKSLNKETNEWE